MEPRQRSRVATGAALIGVGLVLFGMQYVGEGNRGQMLFLAGGLFLAGYLFSRTYALLVPAGILLGLGLGSLGEQRFFGFYGDLSLLGLGIGFVLIYLVALLYERSSHWWPLVPGTILILFGLRAWRRVVDFLFPNGWPLILVAVGLLILIGALGGRGKPTAEP